LTSIGSGLIAITGLYFFHKRLKNQDKQIQIQNQDNKTRPLTLCTLKIRPHKVGVR
jgi:putative Mn2+ efflux pump MntP